MRSTPRTLAIVAVLVLCASCAHGGVIGRLGDAGLTLVRGGAKRAGAFACSPLTFPVAAAPGSLETDVLCLDTTLQMRLLWLRFEAGDRQKVDRELAVGGTVVVVTSSPVQVRPDLQGFQPHRWEGKPGGNPGRAEFLRQDGVRLPLLAWALRGDPEAVRHFSVELYQVSTQIGTVVATLQDLGLDPELPAPAMVEVQDLPSSAELVACVEERLRLRTGLRILANAVESQGAQIDAQTWDALKIGREALGAQ